MLTMLSSLFVASTVYDEDKSIDEIGKDMFSQDSLISIVGITFILECICGVLFIIKKIVSAVFKK